MSRGAGSKGRGKGEQERARGMRGMLYTTFKGCHHMPEAPGGGEKGD